MIKQNNFTDLVLNKLKKHEKSIKTQWLKPKGTNTRYFYIDNTDPDEPFLAYDSEPVDDIYVKFINYPKLKGNFAKMDGIMYVTKKGTTLTCATGLFRENGTANIYNNNRIIEYNIGTVMLYESQGKRRVYVKINWNGTFFEQWKRLAIYDELNL